MSVGNCDICGNWDGALVEGACVECTTRYSCNIVEARETFDALFKDLETKVGKLERIANLARVSMACAVNE